MSETVTAAGEPTRQEMKMQEPCERRFCDREVVEPALVPVTAGNVEQHWCPDCVEDEFDLDWVDYQDRQQSVWRFVTVETVTAFLLGVTLMLLVASVMAV